MDLKFLGTGSEFNTKLKNNSAFIKDENSLILIDCGSTVFSKIKEIDLLKEVNNVYVLITHFHADHIGSLCDLISYTHFKKSYNIQVFSPDKAIIELLRLQGAKEGIHYEFTKASIDPKNPTVISDSNFFYKIFAVKTTHDDNISNYGFCLEEYKKQIVNNESIYKSVDKIYYSGDALEINDFVYKNINSLNKVYHDVSDEDGLKSISLNKISNIIPDGIKNKFYLMHFSSKALIDKAKQKGFNTVKEV